MKRTIGPEVKNTTLTVVSLQPVHVNNPAPTTAAPATPSSPSSAVPAVAAAALHALRC